MVAFLNPAIFMPAKRPPVAGGRRFELVSPYQPAGDQPPAIAALTAGVQQGEREQVLLGVTGSGKTFSIANVIAAVQRPTLVLAPNKILAAQLYAEMKGFFPDNAVEYFVSYYDYYQPEAYVPRTDTYIAKDCSINEQIDRMRHAATRALLERNDVIIVASVSCIYGIGAVETYAEMVLRLRAGDRIDRRTLLQRLVELQYKRNDLGFARGFFRAPGDVVEIFPSHLEDRAWKLSLFGDEIEAIWEVDPLTGEKTGSLDEITIYPNSHYVTPRPTLQQAIPRIKQELKAQVDVWSAAAGCWRRSGCRSAPPTTWRCWRRSASATASRTIPATSPAAIPASRRRRCSSTSPRTRCWWSTRATSPCRSWAACTAATSSASRRWPSTASGCRRASTTGR